MEFRKADFFAFCNDGGCIFPHSYLFRMGGVKAGFIACFYVCFYPGLCNNLVNTVQYIKKENQTVK